MLANTQRELTIMFLHAETTAQSRLATYSKNGSAEHLFALIDLCDPDRAAQEIHPCSVQGLAETEELEAPQRNREELDTKFGRRLSLQNVIGRDRPASGIGV